MDKIKLIVGSRRALVGVCAVLVVAILLIAFVGKSGASAEPHVIYSLDQRHNDQEIVKLIDSAQKYAYFAVYYFSEKKIADALVNAKIRGVDVEGITDDQASTDTNKDVVAELRSAGIKVETQQHQDGIMHMKVLVTEKAYASGSYNWTGAATEANDEVLEIGTDDTVRNQYLAIVKKVLAANDTGDSGEAKTIGQYDYSEALQHIGEMAKVTGTVIRVGQSKSGVTFFDYCSSSKKCPFSAIIFQSDAAMFPDVTKYQGRITVTGVIRDYQGQAEIVISDPSQISIGN